MLARNRRGTGDNASRHNQTTRTVGKGPGRVPPKRVWTFQFSRGNDDLLEMQQLFGADIDHVSQGYETARHTVTIDANDPTNVLFTWTYEPSTCDLYAYMDARYFELEALRLDNSLETQGLASHLTDDGQILSRMRELEEYDPSAKDPAAPQRQLGTIKLVFNLGDVTQYAGNTIQGWVAARGAGARTNAQEYLYTFRVNKRGEIKKAEVTGTNHARSGRDQVEFRTGKNPYPLRTDWIEDVVPPEEWKELSNNFHTRMRGCENKDFPGDSE